MNIHRIFTNELRVFPKIHWMNGYKASARIWNKDNHTMKNEKISLIAKVKPLHMCNRKQEVLK